LPLPTPDEASLSSDANAADIVASNHVFKQIEDAINTQYVRGRHLDITLAESISPRAQEMVRDLCGKEWDVQFSSDTMYNQATYIARIQAADEVRKRNDAYHTK
jgi:hypothetical protein